VSGRQSESTREPGEILDKVEAARYSPDWVAVLAVFGELCSGEFPVYREFTGKIAEFEPSWMHLIENSHAFSEAWELNSLRDGTGN